MIFKDTHQVDWNLERINFWSVVHLLIMVVVGFTQVYFLITLYAEIIKYSLLQVFMVKQLFEDKSMVKNLIAST